MICNKGDSGQKMWRSAAELRSHHCHRIYDVRHTAEYWFEICQYFSALDVENYVNI